VLAAVARFRQMIENPPTNMPRIMPMTAAVAPMFAARYPEASIIFDNLHSMHDVVSDILANPSVPRGRKRAEILLAARRFRDDTSYVMPVAAWRTMAQHMGLENMGGPSVGFLPTLPTPTVTYGAVMQHDDRTGAMTGFTHGGATADSHAGHDRAGMAGMPATKAPAPAAAHDSTMAGMSHEGMSHEGMSHGAATDTTRSRTTEPGTRVTKDAPAATPRASTRPTARRPAAKAPVKAPVKAPATTKPAPKTADPHAGHRMP
jgi:hypothetical protein